MKRTELKRKTPLRAKTSLKRNGSLQRTSSLRKQSKKKQRDNNRMRAPRKGYLEVKGHCPVCGEPCTEVHEIARGPSREQAFKDADTWLGLCHTCHEAMGGYTEWPVARQIALKMVVVLDAVNGARSGRAQTSLDEIIEHLRELKAC